MNNFGKRLKNVRKSLGLSMDELASASGYSQSYISQLESGKRIATTDAIDELSKGLVKASNGSPNTEMEYWKVLSDAYSKDVDSDSKTRNFALKYLHNGSTRTSSLSNFVNFDFAKQIILADEAVNSIALDDIIFSESSQIGVLTIDNVPVTDSEIYSLRLMVDGIRKRRENDFSK